MTATVRIHLFTQAFIKNYKTVSFLEKIQKCIRNQGQKIQLAYMGWEVGITH